MLLPSLRNCSLEFLKDIVNGKEKYLLQSQLMNFHVVKCPQLIVSELIKLIKSIDEITRYLPDLLINFNAKAYIERGFLNAYVYIQQRIFPNAIAKLNNLRLNVREDLVLD